jgi:hypothetical protein
MRRIFDLTLGIGTLGTSIYGKYLQHVALQNPESYNWFTGHLSDLTLPAALVFGMRMLPKNKHGRHFDEGSAWSIPCGFTMYEITQSPGDIQDVVCYWAGAYAALGISKLVWYMVGNKDETPKLEGRLQED